MDGRREGGREGDMGRRNGRGRDRSHRGKGGGGRRGREGNKAILMCRRVRLPVGPRRLP